MSSTGFGEDRPYGAIDDDDDFIEEWRSSWEPTPRSHINEVIEPVVVSAPEPEHGSYEPEPEAPAEYQLSDLELERVYEQGLYAPSVSEPVAEPVDQSIEEPVAAEPVVEQPAAVAEEPVANPYDIEAIHAGIATDPTLQSLSATVVAAHPLPPVVAPEPVAEQWTPPVAPEPEFTPEPVAEQWTPPSPEPVAELDAPAAEAFAELAAPAEPEAPAADGYAEPEESAEPVAQTVPEVTAAEDVAAPETMYEQPGAVQPASHDIADDDTAASDTVPTATPFADTETVDEPEVAPLEAPDDYDGMELVEWEPEPLAAFAPPVEPPAVEAEAVPIIESFTTLPELSDVPAGQVAEVAPEPESYASPAPDSEPEAEVAPEHVVDPIPEHTPEPVAESVSAAEPPEPPDHSVGLTGAAAAALAAAAAWGMWGQPGASVAEPFVEPEPEPYTPPADDAPQVAEPAPESYEVEPEPYTEPEPQSEPAVSDSETWVATSMDTTPLTEPEALTAPEPDAWANRDLETTPIPEPFTPSEPEAISAAEPDVPADEVLDADSAVTSPPVVAPELLAHEQVHAWADQTTTYDLSVDVTSIIGTAMHFAPAEVSGVAPQATDPQRQVVVNDQLAEAISHRPSVPDPVAEPYDTGTQSPSEPVVAESPFAPLPVPIAVESPFAPAAEPAQRATFASPADTYAMPSYEPIEIRPYESSYAPVVEPTHAVPAAVEAPATDDVAWPEPVPPAPAWPTETTREATPSSEHAEASHEHGASSWLERAKARVADIYYDPDADAPGIAEDQGGQTR